MRAAVYSLLAVREDPEQQVRQACSSVVTPSPLTLLSQVPWKVCKGLDADNRDLK